MAGTDFLGALHPIYVANRAGWEREERRLFGGDAVTEELFPFLNEVASSLSQRQAQSAYINFPDIHASLLAGHLHSVCPMPNFGKFLGEVRSRDDIQGKPTLAELLYYNIDGIGNDGSQWDAYMLAQQIRAIALGHVWSMVELPTSDKPTTRSKADVLSGHRPYVVPYSPLHVPYWEDSHGQLDCAILRTPVLAAGKALWESGGAPLGYYAMTRAGFTGFGGEYEAGGWWIFDSEKALTLNGEWSDTVGRIPLVPLFGSPSRGTMKHPAMSRSLTMELGQIAVALMNRISERDFDARDAAKSVRYLLGVSPEAWALVKEHHDFNSILVPVPPTADSDGKLTVPTIHDGSTGAIVASVYQTIIDSTVAIAHEIMVRQVTSTPDSSGASKRAGFGEATSPLLAGLAARRETFENAILSFIELRAGNTSPSAFVTWPKEFDLAPLLSKVERTLARERDAALIAPTMRAALIERAAVEDGTWPADRAEADIAREELVTSGRVNLGKAQAETVKLWIDAGAPDDIALARAGFTPEEITAWMTSDPTEGRVPNEGDPVSGDMLQPTPPNDMPIDPMPELPTT